VCGCGGMHGAVAKLGRISRCCYYPLAVSHASPTQQLLPTHLRLPAPCTGNNVLLEAADGDERGYRALVSDFGLARVVAGEVTTSTFGTCSHMAPELMTEGILGKAADVWSFGVIAWEMYRCEGFVGRGGSKRSMWAAGVDVQGFNRWLACCLARVVCLAGKSASGGCQHAWLLCCPAATLLSPCSDASCPPFSASSTSPPVCSGVRAYVGFRMPNIIFLVTSGKGQLKLPESAPAGYRSLVDWCLQRDHTQRPRWVAAGWGVVWAGCWDSGVSWCSATWQS
jgi:serine/threonine protein kinase